MAITRTLAPFATLLAALALALPAMAQSTAYVRNDAGQWRPISVQSGNGRVSLRLDPSTTGRGQALLVLNKPAWMTLADDKPPVLKSLKVNSVAVRPGAPVVLPNGRPSSLVVNVADEANPIDTARVRLSTHPPLVPLSVDGKSLAPPARSGAFALNLPALAPGAYVGSLLVPDRSPRANTLTVPLSLYVLGLCASDDRQSLRIASGGAGYTVTGGPQTFLRIGDDGPTMYLTSQVAGEYLYTRRITSCDPLPAAGDETKWRVVAEPGTSDGKPVPTKARLQFDLAVRPSSPCLFVTSRTFNDAADGEVYCFWGWLPGKGYVTRDGAREWKMQYADIGQVSWVYLPAAEAGRPGVGIISPMSFGESRFGTLLLYTVPQRVAVKVGGAVETRLAVMPAASAEEVRAQAAAIKW